MRITSKESPASLEFQEALDRLELAFRDGIKEFAEWHSKEWQLSKEEWIKSYDDEPPTDEWIQAYNEGVTSILDSVDAFIGEFFPN